MSSCLSSRACGFDLEHLVKWQISNNYSRTTTTTTTSNSSSPSSTLSESSNSPITISNQKPRTPRKRPNQTYNEAAAVLSMASPNIFKLNNIPKFTKQHLPGFFDHPPELIMNNSGGLLRRQFTNKPCSLTDLKIHNSCQVNEFLDDFDTGSILNEEIGEGIDSIMGDCNSVTGNNELVDNGCYGYPMGLGFGARNGVRALRNAGDRNRCDFTMVDVVNTSTAVIGKCVGKKKKKRVEDLMRPKLEVRRGLVLKLDYDAVLNDWADKECPVPEDISHSSSSRGDIHSMELAVNRPLRRSAPPFQSSAVSETTQSTDVSLVVRRCGPRLRTVPGSPLTVRRRRRPKRLTLIYSPRRMGVTNLVQRVPQTKIISRRSVHSKMHALINGPDARDGL